MSALLNKVSDLEGRIGIILAPLNKVDTIEDTIAEIEERRRKSRNIIVFNLEESRTREDVTSVTAILSSITSRSIDGIRTRRIGRVVNDRIRPICVTLASEAVAREILKNNHKYTGS